MLIQARWIGIHLKRFPRVASTRIAVDRLSQMKRTKSTQVHLCPTARPVVAERVATERPMQPEEVLPINPPHEDSDDDYEQYPIDADLRRFVSIRRSLPCDVDHTFNVYFLGTGSGQGLPRRNSAAALRMGRTVYLFDAGEDTQAQLMRSDIRFSDIEKIFITHLHPDHVFGLPTLLLRLNVTVKAKRIRKVQVYGPVGIFNYISMALSLSNSVLTQLRIEVFELTGGSIPFRHPGGARTFPEFRHPSITRTFINPNDDLTWTIQTGSQVATPDDVLKLNAHHLNIDVRAGEVHHTTTTHTLGYVITDRSSQQYTIDETKASALGVAPGPKYRLLKHGFPVETDDGKSQVHPLQVAFEERPPQPRKLAILGDCYNIPPSTANLCKDANIVVHEATIEGKVAKQVRVAKGHSSAADAGQFASQVDAEVLVLTHLPPVIKTYDSVRKCAEEALSAIQGETRVQVACDLMEISIPRNGFRFNEWGNKKQ